MTDYGWPGNVRELKNAVEFAMVRVKTDEITTSDLPPEILRPELGLTQFGRDADRERIIAALRTVGGNRKAAAEYLGMSRATFYRRLNALKIIDD